MRGLFCDFFRMRFVMLQSVPYLYPITGALFTDVYSEFGIFAPPLPPLPNQSPPASSPNPSPPEGPTCDPQPTVTPVDVNDDGSLDVLDVVPIVSCIIGASEEDCPVCGLDGFPSCTPPPPTGSPFSELPCSMSLGNTQFVTLQYGVIADDTLVVSVYGESDQSSDIFIGFGVGQSMATGTAVVSRSVSAAAPESCAADEGAIAQVVILSVIE